MARKVPLAVAIFLAVGGSYLLVTGRERPWGDARIVYEVAIAFERGTLAIRTEWPPMSHKGPDGNIYSQYALLPSIAHAPGRAFYGMMGGTSAPALANVLGSHVMPAFAAALTCALFFSTAMLLARNRRAALAATGVLAFASILAVYARYPMTEAVQAACVMGFLRELVLAIDGDHGRRRGVTIGLWAGAVLNAKAVLVLGVVGGGLAAAILIRDRAALVRLVTGAALGVLPWAAMFLAYNHIRWGSPFDTGYGETLGLWRETLATGLAGLLLSPGKGLLWFSPCAVLAVAAMARTWSAQRRAYVVALAVIVPPMLFHAKLLSWSGDYAWGPRYLVPAIAPLLLPLAPWFATPARRARRWIVRTIVAASFAVQLLGAVLFWDRWILLAREAMIDWLGNPDRGGAAIAEDGRGHCDSCFEDMHGHQWLPPFSPIAGHLWLARHRLAGDSYVVAEADAPWRRYTTLRLRQPAVVYDNVHFDWWALAIDRDDWYVAVAFVALASSMLIGGVWIARRRSRDPSADAEDSGHEAATRASA